MRLRWLVTLWLLVAAVASAQTAEEGEVSGLSIERNLEALRSVSGPLASALGEVDNLQRELEQASSEERKRELRAQLDAARSRIEQLRGHFRDIVGGVEAAESEISDPDQTSLQDQLSELLQPMIGELREATSAPREMDAMRKKLDAATHRKQLADRILERVRLLSQNVEDPLIAQELESVRRYWEGRQAEASGLVEVWSVRMDERERQTPTVWEAVQRFVKGFWRTRGVNLLLALAVAVAGFLLVRKGYRTLRRVGVIQRKTNGTLLGRISDVLSITLGVLVGLIGILLVFYLRGDWLLMTLAVILLIGLIWAGKNAIPPYLEQIRVLINLGPIREGERIVLNGLPWEVASLGLYTMFRNPQLEGGVLRYPLRDVMRLVSRKASAGEPWFPTQVGDWVLMADGTHGQVRHQTPEQVVMLQRGGSPKTYPVLQFLERTPVNLSRGFRVRTTFWLDFRHQAHALPEIEEAFLAALQQGLEKTYGKERVLFVTVEFIGVESSALAYRLMADLDGSLAPEYFMAQRVMQQVCMEACNEQGWSLPATRLAMRQTE